LFFDRKDELEQMQKVLWAIIDNEKNQQLNPDIQIKAIEQLHIVLDKLSRLYHLLPYEVEFGARRHFYRKMMAILDVLPSRNLLSFVDLQKFLLEEMQMQANYQPIMIRTLLSC
jgi:hypothetical protein